MLILLLLGAIGYLAGGGNGAAAGLIAGCLILIIAECMS